MDRLKDKVVIVTGSTSGIGIGIAKLCAKEAAHVVVTGRNVERGQKVVDDIKADGGLLTMISHCSPPGEGCKMSSCRNSTSAFSVRAFCLAMRKASAEMSMAVTLCPSRERLIAMHPEPVPMSRMREEGLASWMMKFTSSLVSGRGISTPGSTWKVCPQNLHSCNTYWTGSPVSRRSVIMSSSLQLFADNSLSLPKRT